MPHVDEGTLHAILDGEIASLDGGGKEALEHLDACPLCRARLEEERAVRAQAAGILAGAPGAVATPPFDEVLARAGHAAPRRRTRAFAAPLGIAATVVVAIGVGWFGRDLAQRAGERDAGLAVPTSDTDVQYQRAAESEAPAAAQADAPAAGAAAGAVTERMNEARVDARTPPAEQANVEQAGVEQVEVEEADVAAPGVAAADVAAQRVVTTEEVGGRDRAAPANQREETPPAPPPPPPSPPVAMEPYVVHPLTIPAAGEWRRVEREEAVAVAGDGIVELEGLEPTAYAVRGDSVRLTYVLEDGEAVIIEQAGVVIAALEAEAGERRAEKAGAPAAARAAASVAPRVEVVDEGVVRAHMGLRSVVVRGALPTDALVGIAGRLRITRD